MSEAAVVLVVMGVGLGGGLLLYRAVRAEGNRRETMSRVDAERAARRDTDGRKTDVRDTDSRDASRRP